MNAGTAPSPLAGLGFILQSITSQVIAAGLGLLVWELSAATDLSIISSTIVALVLTRFLKMPTPWMMINALLPIAAATSFSLSLPSWLFGAPLAALLLLHAPTLWTRVPYYPTKPTAYEAIVALLPISTPFTFVDLGSGNADLLFYLHQNRPLGRYYGVEIGPLPYLVSKVRAAIFGGGAISIRFKDIASTDLKAFDYIYSFLSPAAMPRVWNKVEQELKSGATFISNSFAPPTSASRIIQMQDERQSALYVIKR